MRHTALIITVFTTLAALAPLAAADAKSDARKAFAAGEAADRRGKWSKAIEHYRQAYLLSPHPNVAYNVALDLERLGKLREAYDWYAKFVEQSTDADGASQAEARMEQLRARPAPLMVTSKPGGILVIVDGQKVGKTPYRATLQQGTHVIVVKPNEQGRREHTVTVEFGEKVVIDERYDSAPAPKPKSAARSAPAPAPAPAPHRTSMPAAIAELEALVDP